MKRYATLTWSFLKNGARNDVVYMGNFWAEFFSTCAYNGTLIIFAQLLFLRINTFGNYSKDDFLFVSLLGQLTFYIWLHIFLTPLVKLVENVRSGAFDFLLIRPVSAQFYAYVSEIKPILGLLIGLPNVFILCIVIDWSHIHVSVPSVVAGVIVWLAGMLVLWTMMFALAMPVFTSGDASDMLNVVYPMFGKAATLPYHLLPRWLQLSSFIFIPTLLTTSGSAYIILQKGSFWYIVVGAVVAGVLAIVCFTVLWKRAMNTYASASS